MLCYFLFQEYSKTNKLQGSLMALQQFKQKSSPVCTFSSRQLQRKPTLFESRFCKELMTKNFDKVCAQINT